MEEECFSVQDVYQHYPKCLRNAKIIDDCQHFPNSFSVGNEIKQLSSSYHKSTLPRDRKQASACVSLWVFLWNGDVVRGSP